MKVFLIVTFCVACIAVYHLVQVIAEMKEERKLHWAKKHKEESK